MDTDPTTIVVLSIVYAVILLGGYVWLSLALSRVFPKLGEEGWKAWVPVLREMTVFQLGGYSAAWVVALFLPFINIIGLVVTVLAVHRINATLGRGTGFTVLAVVAYPIWATIVGFTNADRTPRPVVVHDTGYQPFAALPQTASATGVIADPPASAAPARTFGAGSPFDFSPQTPPAAAAPPSPFPSPAVPPAPPQPAGQIAFQPVARVAPPLPPAPPVAQPASSGAPVPPPAPPVLVDPAPAPAATAWSPPAQSAPPAAPPAPPVRPVPIDSVPPLIVEEPAPIVVAPLPPAPAAATAPPVAPPTAFPTLPTSSADGVFDDLPAAAPAPVHQVSDLEATITPSTTPEAFESDLDDDFEDTVIVNRREELWVLSPEGADPIRVTRPVALLGRNPSVSADHPDAQLIRLTDPARTVSKTHARIELVSGAWLIIDLASTNGVYLDDDGSEVELEADVPTTLTPAFRLGELPFRLEREE